MTFWVVAGAFLGLCLTTTSCNGSAGKKAATEVIKAFEKESGRFGTECRSLRESCC